MAQCLVRCPSIRICLLSLTIRLGLWVWGCEDHQGQPHHITAGVHPWGFTGHVDLDHLTEVVLVRFPHCKVTPFLPFHTVLFGRKTLRKGVENYPPTPWGRRIYINYLDFSYKGYLSLLPHLFIFSFIYLYYYKLMGIYLIFQVIIQHDFILLLKRFQLWPLGALSVGFVCFWHAPSTCIFFFFSTSLLSDSARCLPTFYLETIIDSQETAKKCPTHLFPSSPPPPPTKVTVQHNHSSR